MAKNTKAKPAAGERSTSSVSMLLLALLCMAGLVMGVYLIANGGQGKQSNYHNINIEVGQSRTLVTSFSGDFTCSISDSKLLTIDDAHLMTALAPGNVVVIAEGTAGDRETFYVTITGDAQSDLTSTSETTTTTTTTTTETTTTTTVSLAPGSVTGIELTFYAVSLKVGEKKMPIVTMSPANATDKTEKWESSDENVATVNWLGDITAVGAGVCTVRVTSVNNPAVYAEVTVTVLGETTTAPPTPSADVEIIDGVAYVQGILIANKTYGLPKSFDPGVNPEAKAAFDRMQVAASAEMMSLSIVSGYRSYATQEATYKRFVNRDGVEKADTYSARPGHSEHQTGLAFDINYAGDSFSSTPEAAWLAENCWKYGFIIRYPKDKSHITGYKYEPWHIRYLGEETAKKVYESGLTLEEYLGITSKYAE
ncbi:MAG: D-alanyl-D-alanine carboxypeptidase family protein [Oscillospiraceae bacterium]|nr:D-alanyl-D-alanine carboxypeptidase family protein [Oscillospiraceae bacterium]